MSAPATSRRQPGLARQWVGVLGPPAAWAGQFLVSYNLADSLGCSPAALSPLNTSAGLKAALAMVTAAGALVCVVCALVSLGTLRRLRAADDPSPGGRAHWMGVAGLMVSGLFLLIILASVLPLLLLPSPCAPSL